MVIHALHYINNDRQVTLQCKHMNVSEQFFFLLKVHLLLFYINCKISTMSLPKLDQSHFLD